MACPRSQLLPDLKLNRYRGPIRTVGPSRPRGGGQVWCGWGWRPGPKLPGWSASEIATAVFYGKLARLDFIVFRRAAVLDCFDWSMQRSCVDTNGRAGAPIYQHPKTSEPHPQHKGLSLSAAPSDHRSAEPGVVRRRTYIPMRRGFLVSRCHHGLVAAGFWPGGCPTRWMPTSVLRRWRRQSFVMAGPASSTPTRAASSPASPSPTRCGMPASASRLTAVAAGWITSSSSGCGGR